MSTYANEMAAIKSQLMPVGTIIEWSPVSGDSTDLSTPAKVAAYYGFGTWEAYGSGRSTVGADGTHGAGATWGEASHTLTEDELPELSGQIGSGEGSLSGGSGSSGVFRLGGSGIVNTVGVGAVYSVPQMVGTDSRILGALSTLSLAADRRTIIGSRASPSTAGVASNSKEVARNDELPQN